MRILSLISIGLLLVLNLYLPLFISARTAQPVAFQLPLLIFVLEAVLVLCWSHRFTMLAFPIIFTVSALSFTATSLLKGLLPDTAILVLAVPFLCSFFVQIAAVAVGFLWAGVTLLRNRTRRHRNEPERGRG